MHSYILTGIRMGPFVKLLRTHGFTPSPKNLGRLVFILQNCFWSSLFARREKALLKKTIERYPVPADPIIIIGHWRTGSTFLHYLLAKDPRMVAPTLFQVTVPEGFMVSAGYYRPILKALVKHRPMDNVEMAFDDPQEDEFALAKLTGESPLINLIFPHKREYFFRSADAFYPPEGEARDHWKDRFRDFGRKITADSGRILLLKNPAHSLRIPLLLETFPGARFIHIHRHPYKVVASSLNLWKVMADDNQLKGRPYHPTLEEVTAGLQVLYDGIARDAALLPENRYCEVSYEALEKDPLGEIRKIYSKLGLSFGSDFERNATAYLETARHFVKNSYIFEEADKKFVREMMKRHFERYNYPEA
jgi:hypothetical protein